MSARPAQSAGNRRQHRAGGERPLRFVYPCDPMVFVVCLWQRHLMLSANNVLTWTDSVGPVFRFSFSSESEAENLDFLISAEK